MVLAHPVFAALRRATYCRHSRVTVRFADVLRTSANRGGDRVIEDLRCSA